MTRPSMRHKTTCVQASRIRPHFPLHFCLYFQRLLYGAIPGHSGNAPTRGRSTIAQSNAARCTRWLHMRFTPHVVSKRTQRLLPADLRSPPGCAESRPAISSSMRRALTAQVKCVPAAASASACAVSASSSKGVERERAENVLSPLAPHTERGVFATVDFVCFRSHAK